MPAKKKQSAPPEPEDTTPPREAIVSAAKLIVDVIDKVGICFGDVVSIISAEENLSVSEKDCIKKAHQRLFMKVKADSTWVANGL